MQFIPKPNSSSKEIVGYGYIDGQGGFSSCQQGTRALFATDFAQVFFWHTFECKGFSWNRNGASSRHKRSVHRFNLWNYSRICSWYLTSLNLVFGALQQYFFFQLISLSGIWLYLLLIGNPTPAFRAVFMFILLLTGRLLGQVHQPLYTLFATAFFFIFLNPTVIYEVSFQLSFLAVLFILWFLTLYPHPGENDVLWRRLVKYWLISCVITSAVMLGKWPFVAIIFGRL